jgi:hypothetical protein
MAFPFSFFSSRHRTNINSGSSGAETSTMKWVAFLSRIWWILGLHLREKPRLYWLGYVECSSLTSAKCRDRAQNYRARLKASLREMRIVWSDLKLSMPLYPENDRKHIRYPWAQNKAFFFYNMPCNVYTYRFVCKWCLLLQDASRILGHISGMISPHEKKEENSRQFTLSNILFLRYSRLVRPKSIL